MAFEMKAEYGGGAKGAKEKSFAIPRELPLLPLRGTVMFPELILPLVVGREKSIKVVEEALAGEKVVGIVAQKKAELEDPKEADIYKVGTASLIIKTLKMPDGSLKIVVQGIGRFFIKEIVKNEPYFLAQVDHLCEAVEKSIEIDALVANLKGLFQKAAELAPYLTSDLATLAMNIEEPGNLADFITSSLNITVEDKQSVLEALDVRERLNKVNQILAREVDILELGSKIQSQIKEGIDKTQRDFYLREQLKAIQKELGEGDERAAEIEGLRKRIEAAKMPKEAMEAANRELDRLSRMHPIAAEYIVARTYLDWLCDMPWSISTQDNLDITEAQRILDEDHYNLEKVKKRILEYLAVRKLKADMKGPILCFVGPPGVGKTSLGKSIARALGRKFVRLSLGGVRDEAEIRGHRRTYIGALPGRIIQGLKKAATNNPVFMLDEVDKLGADFRGDPSSALLEVLDPEQNFSFSDHYIDVPFDLSKVMFITTANIIDTIPPALRDRMEVLDLAGYTEAEKLAIAKSYLIPKVLKEHGLTDDNVLFEDGALQHIINSYTREAGVRNLEREIANVVRSIAKDVAKGKSELQRVCSDDVSKYLGPEKFFSEVAERTSVPGVAVGLAWTPTGGDIIFVEAAKMPGGKNLNLTGHLGDVMKESAQTALAFVRSNAEEFGIAPSFFEKSDIHVHVPAGAIPKDGPSAGVTILAALVSLLTGAPVRSDVAMTGEITLRGLVLPVGGIKEKVLAAKRAGIKTIILPKRNEKDLAEVPANVKEGLEFKLVQKMGEVIEAALKKEKKAAEPEGEREGALVA